MQAGASDDKVRAVEAAATSALYSERERAAIAYAEAMTITGRRVDDALFARVRASFDEPEIVELTAAVAVENFRSKFNVALGIEAQGFCLLKEPLSLRTRPPGACTTECAGAAKSDPMRALPTPPPPRVP